MEFQDRVLVCLDCRQEFIFSAGEQEFYERKGFKETPKRCRPCRELRKARRAELQSAAMPDDMDSIGNRLTPQAPPSYAAPPPPPPAYTAAPALVNPGPLMPPPGAYSAPGTVAPGVRQVREMYDAVCASCGCTTRVPFRPAVGRPVYCRDCYATRQGQGPTY